MTNLSLQAQERLTLLMEECSETIQACAKILRHGFESTNPLADKPIRNRQALERELGHLANAVDLLCKSGDISKDAIASSQTEKAEDCKKWLHHQANDPKLIEQKAEFVNQLANDFMDGRTIASIKVQEVLGREFVVSQVSFDKHQLLDSLAAKLLPSNCSYAIMDTFNDDCFLIVTEIL